MTVPSNAANARPFMRLYDVVYDMLKYNIEKHHLPSGLVLEEATIARLFGISRAPVASALRRLCDQRLIRENERRGFVIGDNTKPFRQDLEQAGLQMRGDVAQRIAQRNFRMRLYPKIEQEIAACQPFGRFLINASQLAQHHGVSRTIASEALARLERMGIVWQRSARWYAGPLTPEDVRGHYEIRWLLEPVALVQSAPHIDPQALKRARTRARAWRTELEKLDLKRYQKLERDLHIDIVLRCTNRQMAEAIRRSQLPLIATNFSFEKRKSSGIALSTVDEHLAVLDALAEGAAAVAAKALETHLRSAADIITSLLEHSEKTDWMPPPYMSRDDD